MGLYGGSRYQFTDRLARRMGLWFRVRGGPPCSIEIRPWRGLAARQGYGPVIVYPGMGTMVVRDS